MISVTRRTILYYCTLHHLQVTKDGVDFFSNGKPVCLLFVNNTPLSAVSMMLVMGLLTVRAVYSVSFTRGDDRLKDAPAKGKLPGHNAGIPLLT